MNGRCASRPLLLALALLLASAACTAAAPPAAKPASAPAAAPAAPAAPPAAAQPGTTAAQRPTVPTSPATLKVGVLPIIAYAPVFLADERGYFRELGLTVETEEFPNGTAMRPAVVTGQLAVGGGGLNAGTLNLIAREADFKIVADLESFVAGHPGDSALVVRKDLWENGTIRSLRDILGREVYSPGGNGSGLFVTALRWADREGHDISRLTMSNMGLSEMRVALANGSIELAFVSEPNVTAGLERGEFEALGWAGEMYPNQQLLVLVYNPRTIEAEGQLVGERFMIAYLRGVRDYLDAFFYGKNQEAVIDVLVKNTPIKDRELYRKMRPGWIDPNGRVNMSNVISDARLLVQAGVMPEVPNLDNAYLAKYADYAVSYLGEYQPPR
jgi:NitT/TauT family transport system substrate-binding protein